MGEAGSEGAGQVGGGRDGAVGGTQMEWKVIGDKTRLDDDMGRRRMAGRGEAGEGWC